MAGADETPADPLKTAITIANRAQAAEKSKMFQVDEIARLVQQADLLRRNAIWLNLELDALPSDEPLDGVELESKIRNLKSALDVVLKAAFVIGGAAVTHKANRRFVAAERTAHARSKKKELSQRSDRIRDQTLADLKLADLSMGELKDALNAKLRAAGCKQVSERTVGRWKSAFQKTRAPTAKKI